MDSETRTSECKHGLKSGCVYCHGATSAAPRPAAPKRQSRSSRLSERMNDRITTLKKRLRQLRGE